MVVAGGVVVVVLVLVVLLVVVVLVLLVLYIPTPQGRLLRHLQHPRQARSLHRHPGYGEDPCTSRTDLNVVC